MKKRTKIDKMADKVAYLQLIGWEVVTDGASSVIMGMGDRRCTVDCNGRVREGVV